MPYEGVCSTLTFICRFTFDFTAARAVCACSLRGRLEVERVSVPFQCRLFILKQNKTQDILLNAKEL